MCVLKSTIRAGFQSLTVVLLLTAGAAAGDAWVSVAPDGTVTMTDATAASQPQVMPFPEDTAEFRVTVVTPGLSIEPRKTKGGEFVRVGWPDAAFAGEIGTPALPVIRRLFIAPPGTTVEPTVQAAGVVVIGAEILGFPLRVMPVQPPIPKLPGARENAEFIFNESAYGLDADLLVDRAVVEELGIVRGQRLFLLEVRPVDYNPVAETLTLWSDIEVDVAFVGEPGLASPLAPLPGLHRILLNPDPSAPATRGSGNYLIIVSTTFESNIASFATAKGNQGFTVATHVVSPGTPNSTIKSYIQGLWSDPSTAPDYILLVGDTNTIPHWVGGGDGSPDTDLQYACMDGSGDWYPDIAIGRFPARTTADLLRLVDKTLYYENGPLADPEYKKRAVFMAGNDNYQISEGTHNYVIDTWLEPNGYTCDRLYEVTHGATTQDVRNSFNDGRFYGVFSGHGSTTSWGDGPSFSQSDVNNLTNENMYAFICSFSCSTGDYVYTECFMETWVLADNAGLASWGSSVSSYWDEDDILERRLFDAIFDNEDEVKTEVGPIYNETKVRYLAHFGVSGMTRRYFEMYNLMGDPALPLPSACSDVGAISLDRAKYMCEGTALIEVTDCGLNMDDNVVETVEVTIESTSEPAGESVLLTETDSASAQFEGTIPVSGTNAPGTLLVGEGDTITATYIDADDGQGGFDVVVTATAEVDCTAPQISGVQTLNVEPRSARVGFFTDEPARGIVHYGLGCGSPIWTAFSSGYSTSPQVSLTGLQDNTRYYYTVEAEDEAGNSAEDDNNGNCYTFVTPEIPDFFTELFDSDNDLDNLTLVFTPDGSNDFYRGCAETITELPTDPAGGTTVTWSSGTSDDGYGTITLTGATVSIYGDTYSTFFPGTNGYISFVHGETDYTETLEDHFSGIPQISALFDDLNPGSGGTVSWKQLDDRAVVTWLNVPEYSNTGSNTFQIEMFFDGTIAISYLSISAADGLAGLSAGDGLDPDFWETDLSAMGDCTPPDCNGNGIPDECDLDCGEPGGPCDVPGCGQSDDCQPNEIPDECDVAEGGGSLDTNGNGIPDECEVAAPLVVAEGSRYLAVTAQPVGSTLPVALHLAGDPKEPDVSCVSLYVQAQPAGTLGSDPVFQTPAAWETVHVRGEAIIPMSTYDVRAEWSGGESSAEGSATTWAWGDIDNNGLVNLADIMGIITGYQGDFTNATVENLDQRSEVCEPDGIIGLPDIMAAVGAFQGNSWYTSCSAPCP